MSTSCIAQVKRRIAQAVLSSSTVITAVALVGAVGYAAVHLPGGDAPQSMAAMTYPVKSTQAPKPPINNYPGLGSAKVATQTEQRHIELVRAHRAAVRAHKARVAARLAAARKAAARAAQAPIVTTSAPSPHGTPQQIAASMLGSYGWSSSEFSCLQLLWNRESGWNVYAANASGAYGIPQALPGSKMASAGPDWQTSAATQIRWGLGYIRSDYGTPCGAWSHEEADGWY